jgi:hypothetical protein
MPLNINGNVLHTSDITSTGIFKNKIITDGMLFYLDAADSDSYGGSGSTWTDMSGNGRNFSLTSTSFDGNNGGSITSTGSGYGSISSLTLTSGFTLEIWAYMSSTSSFGLFGQGVYGTGQGLHILYQDGSRGMIFGMYSNDNDYQNNYRPSANQWYHWVFTYDGTTYRKQFFANTIKQSAPASVETQYTGSGQFNIGAIYSSPGSQFNGRIGIVKGYNRVLERHEIAQNFQTERSRYSV